MGSIKISSYIDFAIIFPMNLNMLRRLLVFYNDGEITKLWFYNCLKYF